GMKSIESDGAAGSEIALPPIEAVGDPALRLLLGEGRDVEMPPRPDGSRPLDIARIDDDYIVLLRDMPGYGPKSWQVGLRFTTAAIDSEIGRLQTSAMIGLAILIVTVVSSVLVGRHLTRQIRRLA